MRVKLSLGTVVDTLNLYYTSYYLFTFIINKKVL